MKENKKIFGRAAGVFALALVFAFILAACGGGGGDDGSGGGGGGGGGNGTTTLGESLTITGAQIYNYDWFPTDDDEPYEKYSGGDIEFTDETSRGNIGGKVKITDEKLDFTADAITEENLYNVKDGGENDYNSLEDILKYRGLPAFYYTNITITGSGWESAKWAELRSPLGRNEDDRKDSITRQRHVTVYSGRDETHEGVEYIYVDNVITITADGDTKKESSSSGHDFNYVLKPLNITLQKGWNVLYSKRIVSGNENESTSTFELKVENPSNVPWLNEWSGSH